MTLIGNRPEWVYAMVACFRIGAVALPCTEQLRPADLRARMEAVEPARGHRRRAQPRDRRRHRVRRACAVDPRRVAVRRRPGAGERPVPERPGPDHVHVGDGWYAQADPSRPALPVRAGGAGRALVRRPARRPDLVHGGERLVEVGPQRLHRAVGARGIGTAPRRALRPRGAGGDRRARGCRRPVHGADGVPRRRQAHRAAAAPVAAPRGRGRRAAQPGDRRAVGVRGRRGHPRRLRADRDGRADRHADRAARAARVDGQAAAWFPPLDRGRRAVRRPVDDPHVLHRRAGGHLADRRPRRARTRTATCGSRAAPTT